MSTTSIPQPRVWERAGSGDLRGVEVCLARGVNVNEDQDGSFCGALHWAVTNDRRPVAKLLLGAGANPNARSVWQSTPTMAAAKNSNAEVLRALLTAGGDVTAVDMWGKTALFHAVEAQLEGEKRDNVDVLLGHPGVDLGHRRDRKTAAQLARSLGFDSMAAAIEEAVRSAFTWFSFSFDPERQVTG